ncbi:MAG: PHP domain-containing protein [Bacteroidaceae bacterium]|nr:PHP domain-containing protein [Bacteroidaceae bacterium]
MKKLFLLTAAFATFATAAAQSIYYQDKSNKDMMRHTLRNEVLRNEIILPKVNGFQVLKSDLHTHTVYSDGNVTPEYRIQEAWTDGLDVIAITDHVEYRRWEGQMVTFLKGYMPEGTKGTNTNLVGKSASEEGILSDLNLPCQVAKASAEQYGLTLIPGIEITRDPLTIGHYNALFIKDANTVYNADPIVSIKKAREQGAIIMQNHPGWRRKNLEVIEFEQKVYAEDLIDGVEIMNGSEFYPIVVDRASEKQMFMAANTDIHSTTSRDYTSVGQLRNMTLIFAKDKSLDSVKEALMARRTLAYSYGTIAGEEQLVRDFFNACITYETLFEKDGKQRKVRMSNPTSMTFVLNFGGNPVQLRPFTSRDVTINKGKDVTFTVENLWIPGENSHPVFKLTYEMF